MGTTSSSSPQSPAAAVPHRHPDPGGGDAAHRLSRSNLASVVLITRPAGTDSYSHRCPALRHSAGSQDSTDGAAWGT